MALSYLLLLVASSIWAIVWLGKLADMTKLGWPVAQPRFMRRPSARRRTDFLVALKVYMSYWGLMLVRWTLPLASSFSRPAMSTSLSKWPMLATMALSFIAAMWSAVMIL